MPIQNYDEFELHEKLFTKPVFERPEDIFTYQQPHQTRIGHCLLGIVMDERGISEKAYEAQDRLQEELEALYAQHPQIQATIAQFKAAGKRDQYCAEYIFERWLRQG